MLLGKISRLFSGFHPFSVHYDMEDNADTTSKLLFIHPKPGYWIHEHDPC